MSLRRLVLPVFVALPLCRADLRRRPTSSTIPLTGRLALLLDGGRAFQGVARVSGTVWFEATFVGTSVGAPLSPLGVFLDYSVSHLRWTMTAS